MILLCSFGYIPVSKDDPNYLNEESRQKSNNFDPCKCSNCEPEAAKEIHDSAHLFTKENFEHILSDPSQFTEGLPEYIKPKKKRNTKKKIKSRFPKHIIEKISQDVAASFKEFYHEVMGPKPRSKANQYFNKADAKAVAEAIEHIEEPNLIAKLIGGEWFDNQVNKMFLFIKNTKRPNGLNSKFMT
jgi:hypothetical protein